MESTAHPELVGRRLMELAERARRRPVRPAARPRRRRADAAASASRPCSPTTTRTAWRTLLQEDGCTLGLSDAGAHVGQLCDAPLATDLLGQLGAREGRADVEQAVHKLTRCRPTCSASPAAACVREGFAADLVVFDPDTVAPGPLRRVHDFPAGAERLTADQPDGMRHVLVNGTP